MILFQKWFVSCVYNCFPDDSIEPNFHVLDLQISLPSPSLPPPVSPTPASVLQHRLVSYTFTSYPPASVPARKETTSESVNCENLKGKIGEYE